jgi:hypothetical protein
MHSCIVVLLAIAVAGSLGCEDPLEVDNPNSLVEKDLADPRASTAIANGALATTAQGVAFVLAPYTTATDEGTWIGSRDAWRQLNFGNVTDIQNEFVDGAWPFINEGRWMADKAVEQLSAFDQEGTIPDRSDLGRAYLYAAMVRVFIADMFDDFVFSNRTEPAPAVGEDNMYTVYDKAIELAGKALDVARSEGNSELERRALGLRARAKHAKAVWQLLNPKGSTPSEPYVSAGADDAAAALALMDPDYRWQLFYGVGREWNNWAWQVNGRKELAVVSPLPQDPIDGIEDPRIAAAVEEFTDTDRWGGTNYSPVTVISAREMHLIIAESLLANGDAAGARTHMNVVRAMDGLTALDGQISEGEMLQHERRANLFMQGRRLADMYRFGIKDPEWQTTSDAYNIPGSFFPITIRERRANPLIPIGR